MSTECPHLKVVVIFLIAAVRMIYTDAQSSCTTQRLEMGVCVPILTCDTITHVLIQAPKPLPTSVREFVQRSHCGTFNDIPHVCCAATSINSRETLTPEPTQTPTTHRNTTITAIQSDFNIHPSVAKSETDIQTGMAILEALKCGKSNDDIISQGIDANLSEFPWIALLVYTDGLYRTMNCGGSLVTDRYVLTAAHCILVSNKKLVSVRLGEHNINETTDCVSRRVGRRCAPPIQEIDIEEAVYHKDYSENLLSNDIGLIRLITSAIFRSNVNPICLPITPLSQASTVNRMIVAGWGPLETGVKPNIMQKAVIPVKYNDHCQQIHRSIQLTDKQFCAGEENEIGAYKGDSGGPLFITARYRVSARHIQYGIASADSTLRSSNSPSIYVRVTSYLEWIAGNISP